MIDHDNLHKKTFIDAVLKHIFIPDDLPACMDLYHTCMADDNKNTHTAVYVGADRSSLRSDQQAWIGFLENISK